MAFPTTSLTNNQVHKEGNRAFVYDSTLGVWDQVRETDRTDMYLKGAGVTFPTGHVVQTITETTNSETYAGTNASYVTIVGMAGSITPKYSNSKILIGIWCGSMVMTAVDSMYTKVTGTTTGTVTEKTRYPGYYNHSSGWVPAPIAFQVVDTPGTTNTQTYQLLCKVQTGTTTNNWRVNSSEGTNTQGGTVILQEIKV